MYQTIGKLAYHLRFDFFYSLLSNKEHRFIVRGCYDRALVNGKHLREEFAEESRLFSKEIHLSRRNKKSGGANNKRLVKRDARNTIVDIKAKQITLKRSNCVDKKYALSLDINAVLILERNPPKDEKPIEWILLTQEPIASRQDIEKIIECYCSRWVIEEYFKVLKTGCSYEKRQLESFHSLKNCLGVFIPIAPGFSCGYAIKQMKQIAHQNFIYRLHY